jgi:hypothetical protein
MYSDMPLMMGAVEKAKISSTNTPITFDFFVRRLFAALLGWYPVFAITSRTRCRFSAVTGFVPLITYDTVADDTPACFAISLIVIENHHLMYYIYVSKRLIITIIHNIKTNVNTFFKKMQ